MLHDSLLIAKAYKKIEIFLNGLINIKIEFKFYIYFFLQMCLFLRIIVFMLLLVHTYRNFCDRL